MSRNPGDARPPKIPKPKPIPEPGDQEDGASTFQPNPSRARPTTSGGGEDASTFRANPRRAGVTKPTAKGGGSPDGVKTYGVGEAPTFYERVIFGRVSSGQLAAFCRQFAAYSMAGVDLTRTLVSLQNQFARTALGPVIGRMHQSVKRGESLTDAAEREPQAFDSLFVSMIKVAEMRGGVPETLKTMAKHYESRQNLIRQARSAMIYPIIVILCATGVIALLTLWLLPMFAATLRDFGGPSAQLPLPSRLLLAFSDFMVKMGWLVMPALLIGTPILIYQFYKTKKGKEVMDSGVLYFPVFGPLVKKIDMARFSRTMASLLNSGVDMGASLSLTSGVMRLDPFKKAVTASRLLVIHGDELSEALIATKRFGYEMVAVVEAGEETGKLPETLDHLADDYEEQIAITVKNLGQLVQPMITIGLGGVVLFIALAFVMAYLSLLTAKM